MSNKQFTELAKKSLEDLHKHMLELKRELMNLRFQKAAGELEKTHRFKEVRHEIARIKTLQAQKAKA